MYTISIHPLIINQNSCNLTTGNEEEKENFILNYDKNNDNIYSQLH